MSLGLFGLDYAARKQLGRFIFAGGASAVVNIVSRILLNLFMPFEAAVVLAFLCSMTVAYTLNRAFVFVRSGRPVRDEYMRFAIVNLLTLAQIWIVSVSLVRLMFPDIGFDWHTETVAHIVGVAVPTVTSYFGHRYFTFAPAK